VPDDELPDDVEEDDDDDDDDEEEEGGDEAWGWIVTDVTAVDASKE